MGRITLEGFGVRLTDLDGLHAAPETRRLRLRYEVMGDAVEASAIGNVSTYYVLIQELLRHLERGALTGTVELSNGTMHTLRIARAYVMENDEDISRLFDLPEFT